MSNDVPSHAKTAFGPWERCFALVAAVLGFVFWRWQMIVMAFGFQGWGITMFALVFVATVSLYFRRIGQAPNREANCWRAVVVVTALSFAVWSSPSIAWWRFVFLFGTATYWVVMQSGNTTQDSTNDHSPFEFLRGALVVPLSGLGMQLTALLGWRRPRTTAGGNVGRVLWGLGLGLLIVSIVMPLLLAADAGGFAVLTTWLRQFDFDFDVSPFLWVQLVLSLPTGAFIFALVVGNALQARQRRSNPPPDSHGQPDIAHGLLHPTTATALLAVVNTLYLVFFLSQLPYFFSAFGGRIPEGWTSYAQFARQGFFELCVIAMINLAVIIGVRWLVDRNSVNMLWLRLLLTLLPALTLLFIVTAVSKLYLYVANFGMTTMRLLPAVVLIWLAVVFASLVISDRVKMSRVRIAVVTGVVLMLALSWLNVDGLVASHNAGRYLNGTLSHFDTTVLHRAGVAGVPTAVMLIEKSDDLLLQHALRNFVQEVKNRTVLPAGEDGELGWHFWLETWQRRQARVLIDGITPYVTLDQVRDWVRSNPLFDGWPGGLAVQFGGEVYGLVQILYPYAVLQSRDRTEVVSWIVDLRDGSAVVGGGALTRSLQEQWSRLAPDDVAAVSLFGARLFGLSPDNTRLGLVLATHTQLSATERSVIGYIDLNTNTASFTGMTRTAFHTLAKPTWSPTGRFVVYGVPADWPAPADGVTALAAHKHFSRLYVDTVATSARLLTVDSAMLSTQLWPTHNDREEFNPWIGELRWSDDDTTLEFQTVAAPFVDRALYWQAQRAGRLRQDLGQGLWSLDTVGGMLTLKDAFVPERWR